MFANSVQEARRRLTGFHDRAHDIQHARRTAKNARDIGYMLEYSDLDFLELCGWWHDVGRCIDNDHHEAISAQLVADDLLQRGASTMLSQRAYDAIVFHKWSMTPKTAEGFIIRDADKLDFISIERWKSCIEAKQYTHIREMQALLPKLESLFYFDKTVALYQKRITEFDEYAATIVLPE